MKLHLSGVPETLFIPLWARAMEARRSDAIVKDAKASRLITEIDYDFTRFEGAWKTQLGVAGRTLLIDLAVKAFLAQHPTTVVLNLGAGLDNRFQRIDNGTILWYELDLPAVIDAKRHFFEESHRYRFIPASVFDPSWVGAIHLDGRPCLIIAEGLFMYFDEARIHPLFTALAERFQGAEMLVEMIPGGAVGKSAFHDVLRFMAVELKWTLSDCRAFEAWNSGIKLVEEWCILDYHRERWGWMGVFADQPLFRYYFGEKIIRLKFEK